MASVTGAQAVTLGPLAITKVKETEYFHMPDLLHNFPWNNGLNKHYAEAKVQSDAWLGSLQRVSSKKQAMHNSMDFPFLATGFFPRYVIHVFQYLFLYPIFILFIN